MTSEYMSSEHSMSESEASHEDLDSDSDKEPEVPNKSFSIKKLTWRSEEADKVMATLDRKVGRMRGNKGNLMCFKRVVKMLV